jgi:hypothetical protein
VGSIVPHGESAAPHAAPVIVQVTCWSVVPATFAVKSWLAPGASVTLGGRTLTTTCGMMVMALLALFVASAWLTTLSVTGFGEGTADGAT